MLVPLGQLLEDLKKKKNRKSTNINNRNKKKDITTGTTDNQKRIRECINTFAGI